MKTNILIEAVELVEGTLNRETREVEAVLIRPGWSSNGRYYPPAALAKAALLYENSRAFANHPTPEQVKRGEGRSVTDLTGRFFNVRVGDAGELRATRKVYDNPAGNAVWPAIIDAVENHAPVIGLSINAVGKAAHGTAPDGKEGVIVEEITAVSSVDDVINPAAGGSFERLIASGDELLQAVLESMTLDELTTARPDLLDNLRTQMKRARQDEAVRAVSEEKASLETKLAEAQAEIERLQAAAQTDRTAADSARQDATRAELAVALEKALREARLLPDWETELRTQLTNTTPADWPAAIARLKKLAQSAGLKQDVPVNGAPRLMESAAVQTRAPEDDLKPRDGEGFDAWNRRISGRGKG